LTYLRVGLPTGGLSADGLLIIRWTDGLLEAVDPGDGPRSSPAMPWTLKLDGEPTGQMIGSDGLMAVLATKRDGLATVLVDVFAGRTVCELHRPGPAWPTALRWAGGELVLVYPDAVEAYDRADGRLLWRHATGAGETAPAGVAMDPGRVFLTDRSRRVTAFEARSGRTLWSVVPADPARAAVARAALLARRGGDVLVCDGRAIAALSAADGSLRWRAEVGGESLVRELIPGESAVVTVAGGQFGLPEPVEIAAFDPATGALLGRRRVADDGHATLVAAGYGTVVLLHRTVDRCRLLGFAPDPPAPSAPPVRNDAAGSPRPQSSIAVLPGQKRSSSLRSNSILAASTRSREARRAVSAGSTARQLNTSALSSSTADTE
jgi:outer membrane protein assembly factor BamB